MSFWKQQFPGQIYELDYEKITENIELESRGCSGIHRFESGKNNVLIFTKQKELLKLILHIK